MQRHEFDMLIPGMFGEYEEQADSIPGRCTSLAANNDKTAWPNLTRASATRRTVDSRSGR